MAEKINNSLMIGIIWMIALSLALIAFGSCDKPEKMFTIGIPHNIPLDAPIVEGFKAGMSELGYVEGKNVKYIYNEIPETINEVIDPEIKELMAQDVDMLLIFESEVALRAKEIVTGTDMPVLFSANIKAIQNNLLESLSHPGGNLTGVRFADTNSKALEWLVRVVPDAKKIYMPYNPDDTGLIGELSGLDRTASQLKIEFVKAEIHSVEEAVKAIENLPKHIDAIFRIPSPTLNARNIELTEAAVKRGIPMGASLLLDEDVLVVLTCDFYDAGKKAARMAQQIHRGIKPADLPVEETEVYLNINLKTAEKLGIFIPDNILAQAKTIIR